MPKIDYSRPEVRLLMPKWQKIRHCIDGQDAIKFKRELYLPKPNASDKSKENQERYEAYLKRAVFYNVVDNTVRGLTGQVFAADPVFSAGDSEESAENSVLKPVILDADGAGVSLMQLAKKSLSETLAFGRCGVMVDFPLAPLDENGVPRVFTAAEIQSGAARPTILQYSPEQIINWRMRLVDMKLLLSLVVISKDFIKMDDGFELEMDTEWRVLRLDAQNLYVLDVWRRNDDPATKSAEPFKLFQSVMPTDSTGARLAFIPFSFIGSLNNNELPDKPPMYDMAELNLAHYRNSADYEDSCYMVGQPTPVFTGVTKDWVTEVWKGSVQLGSRGGVPLPQGGTATMLQADANTMIKEAMDKKEQQMVALGAQLVQDKQVERTLGEAQMEAATVSSTLVQCAKNVACVITKALQWASLFYGPEDETIDYQLSTDFAITKLDPLERTATVADFQAGLISWTEARYTYRQSGLAYLDDKEAKAEIEKDQAEAVNMDATDPTDPNADPNDPNNPQDPTDPKEA
jgi:hypothetical protein